jgi:formylglycine-generating enzyme required for sulfatase activity
VPDGIEGVFAKALAVHPEQRFARARELWSAFEAALGGAALPSHDAAPGHAGPAVPGSASAPALERKSGSASGGRVAIAAAIAGGLFITVALGAAALLARRTMQGAVPSSSAAPVPLSAPPPAVPNASASGPSSCPTGTVRFAAAEYFMGSDHQHSPANERPAHQVKLSPFCLDQREVTVRRYKACADAGRCREAPVGVAWPGITKKETILFGATCNAQYRDREEHPINCIDWNLAKSFCEAGAGRLPSEAEWEFAARGPSVTRYPWGDGPPEVTLLNACDMACKRWGQRNDIPVRTLFEGIDTWPTTAPVGSFTAGRSRLDLDDIAGNVREWTADWYGPYPATVEADPRGAARGERRVVRGSAWITGDANELPRSFRATELPAVRRHDLGFRCAYSL